MLKKLIAPAVLSLACALMVTSSADAQKGGGKGGGGGGGNRGGGNSGGRNWNSGSYGNYYGNNYYGNRGYYNNGYYGNRGYYNNNYPYYGTGVAYGLGYLSGYLTPRYYGGGYGGGGYSYPSNGYSSSYYEPAQYSQPAIPEGSATIRVIVPDERARVWFDGAVTQQTGTDRLFHTPPLDPRVTNTYRIRATWYNSGVENTQERVVNVNPGGFALVDFR